MTHNSRSQASLWTRDHTIDESGMSVVTQRDTEKRTYARPITSARAGSARGTNPFAAWVGLRLDSGCEKQGENVSVEAQVKNRGVTWLRAVFQADLNWKLCNNISFVASLTTKVTFPVRLLLGLKRMGLIHRGSKVL